VVELTLYPDPDRPRNDKATILGDTIQMLKDLTTQVNKLKAEYTSLSEEAREVNISTKKQVNCRNVLTPDTHFYWYL
jgi:hypothetical protein